MNHPYHNAPDHRRWSKAVASIPLPAVDPVLQGSFRINASTKIATAGSCFAQHIGRHLSLRGFNHHVVEKSHPIIPLILAQEYNYGIFSARYGNVYTTRQLVQLVQRAFGLFTPQENVWCDGPRFIDPFRPQIEPDGFSSLEEFHADREQHFECVRRLFKEADVFIFTFGLTEHWHSLMDGATFPVCPGVAGGQFDSNLHGFTNSTVDDVVREFMDFAGYARALNPRLKILLTVSPVPLAATAEDRHVVVATTYSKAVLRVAAEMITKRLDGAYYFPSYEIIAAAHARGAYYADDLRNVTELGVAHVMGLFFEHYAADAGESRSTTPVPPEPDAFLEMSRQVSAVMCEEAALDRRA